MRWLSIITVSFTLMTFSVLSCGAQSPCPTGMVCFEQKTANDIFDKLNQLVASKDLNIKLLAERGTADQALANALKVIQGHVELDAVNQQIIVKKDQVITLYERVMQIQMQIIENLEKRLLKPRSPWGKFLDVLKSVTLVLAGVALGGL